MNYDLAFLPEAKREWLNLDAATQSRFKDKLRERLINPKVPSARLSGSRERYKIKLQSIGYRLVYEVRDAELVVVVIAIGKRDKMAVYEAAARRKPD
jgi:mRNA interferase RelE/StbE